MFSKKILSCNNEKSWCSSPSSHEERVSKAQAETKVEENKNAGIGPSVLSETPYFFRIPLQVPSMFFAERP